MNDYLDNHLWTNIDKKSDASKVCNEEFLKKGNMSDHFAKHASKEPHVCEICKKDFPRKIT